MIFPNFRFLYSLTSFPPPFGVYVSFCFSLFLSLFHHPLFPSVLLQFHYVSLSFFFVCSSATMQTNIVVMFNVLAAKTEWRIMGKAQKYNSLKCPSFFFRLFHLLWFLLYLTCKVNQLTKIYFPVTLIRTLKLSKNTYITNTARQFTYSYSRLLYWFVFEVCGKRDFCIWDLCPVYRVSQN